MFSSRSFLVCWHSTGGCNATRSEEGAWVEGDRPSTPGTAGVPEELMVLTVPDIAIIDGPGYRRSYGETTKRAAEGSVFSLPMLPQGQMGLGVLAIRIGQP
jgi:hypothetical protein